MTNNSVQFKNALVDPLFLGLWVILERLLQLVGPLHSDSVRLDTTGLGFCHTLRLTLSLFTLPFSQSQIDWFLQESGAYDSSHSVISSIPNKWNKTGHINQIERPFSPDTGKDFGDSWKRQGSDQLTPETKKLAKPNALMFFHIPLCVLWSHNLRRGA